MTNSFHRFINGPEKHKELPKNKLKTKALFAQKFSMGQAAV